MALTINQSDLYHFERLVSKLTKPSEPPMVCFIPCNDGITLAAFCTDAILTMTVDKTGFVDPFSLSWATVKTLSAKKYIDMSFTLEENTVHVQIGEEQRWVPREKQVNTLPSHPPTTVTHSKELLDAIQSASKCTDPNSMRFALGGVCLRGEKSQILATTGTQLLVQEGFEFPWDNDVICPTAKILACKALTEIDSEVLLGYVDSGWVYFSIGKVSLWLRAIEGRFPKVDQLIVPTENMAYLEIHPTDATFLLEKLETLPGKKEDDSPVHMILNDMVQVRAYDTSQKSGVTLELTRSTFTGESVNFAMNRLFLKNALQFGCLKIGIDPTGTAPALCTGDDKTFVFMPLDRKEPEVEPARMSTIVSHAQSIVTAPPAPMKRRRRTVKRDTVRSTGKTELLEQAEQTRSALRNALVSINTLVKGIKAQKQQDRLLRNTMDSLRKLSIV